MNFNFKVNDADLSVDDKIISGSEILDKAGFLPVEKYDLYKKIKGHEFEPIQYDEKVDLEEPGIECFKVSIRAVLLFDVDDETFTTEESKLTPIQILQIAGLDPSKYYLKQIKEYNEINYKQDQHITVDMIGHLKFITCKDEPTTVS